jgi:hypothetical protein
VAAAAREYWTPAPAGTSLEPAGFDVDQGQAGYGRGRHPLTAGETQPAQADDDRSAGRGVDDGPRQELETYAIVGREGAVVGAGGGRQERRVQEDGWPGAVVAQPVDLPGRQAEAVARGEDAVVRRRVGDHGPAETDPTPSTAALTVSVPDSTTSRRDPVVVPASIVAPGGTTTWAMARKSGGARSATWTATSSSAWSGAAPARGEPQRVGGAVSQARATVKSVRRVRRTEGSSTTGGTPW